jgi:hypothetical protein
VTPLKWLLRGLMVLDAEPHLFSLHRLWGTCQRNVRSSQMHNLICNANRGVEALKSVRCRIRAATASIVGKHFLEKLI